MQRTATTCPMHAPFVSVVVPVLNDRVRLGLCLRALEKQSYPRDSFEVVVVDNGSDRAVFDAARSDLHVAVVAEPQPGSYAARNTGIREAKGEIIAFTDSDCIPHEDWLESGVAHLARMPQGTILAGKIERASHHRLTVTELYDHAFFLRPDLYARQQHGFAVTANLVVAAAVFRRVGLFDPVLLSGGDREWCRRASRSGITIQYADDVRVWHPAIATVSGLIRKATRVVGGLVECEVRHADGIPARLRGIRQELSDTVRKWRQFRAEHGQEPVSTSVCVGALIVVIQLARAAERVRLLCGGKPQRQ